MAITTQSPERAKAPLLIETTWFPLAALIANVVAIVVVNFWIYHARTMFIANHPEYVSQQPPTVSRAISDPMIGQPFAIWISGSALLLVFGVGAVCLFYFRLAGALPAPQARLARAIRRVAIALFIAQVFGALGMYLLSNYRFPDGNEMHMLGSYIFFTAQAGVITGSLIVALILRRNRDQFAASGAVDLPGLAMIRLRLWLSALVVVATVSYVGLFVAKGFDFGDANTAIYWAYVHLEPALISGFLVVLGLFQTDLWTMVRRRS